MARSTRKPRGELPQLFEAGLAVRRQVLGADYVDRSLAEANDFMRAFQHITTEMCWGYAWTRPGLDRRTRSLVNLAMLTALSKPAELQLHVKGALNNGVSVDEIREVLLHATVYCGIPAGLEAFKAANQVLVEAGVLPATGASPAQPATSAASPLTAEPMPAPARPGASGQSGTARKPVRRTSGKQ